MALKISIGQYYAAASPVHALDARVKLWCVLATLVAIFCAANGLANLFSPTAVFLPGLLLARVQYPTWLKWALVPIVVIAVASVVITTGALMVL